MPLKLITGPVNSGKAAIVLDAVAVAAAEGAELGLDEMLGT